MIQVHQLGYKVSKKFACVICKTEYHKLMNLVCIFLLFFSPEICYIVKLKILFKLLYCLAILQVNECNEISKKSNLIYCFFKSSINSYLTSAVKILTRPERI